MILVEPDLDAGHGGLPDLVCMLEGRVVLAAPAAGTPVGDVSPPTSGRPGELAQRRRPGVLLGGEYALLACGLSPTFGVMRLVNLAHGDLAVCGAYLALLLGTALGVPAWSRCRWCCRSPSCSAPACNWPCWPGRCAAASWPPCWSPSASPW